MLDINQIQNKYLLRNSSTIPFFYKKFYQVTRPIRNLIHFATIGRIASGVLHDIANPLTALMLSINFNNADKNDIEKCSKELYELIKVVQTQLRNNGDKEFFKISSLIQDCFILMKHKAILNNVRLISVVQKDFNVLLNKISLMRVLINLISNAIESYENQSTERKDVVVSIFEERNFFCISVKDFGCGMSEKQKRKVFKKFYTNKNTGTGIGLYISHKNIRMKYGGKIIVESEIGKGSTFTVKIPLKTSV